MSKVKPLSVGVRFLLFFGLLGLGVLVYVLLEFGVQRRSQKGLVSTAEVSSDTRTKSPVIPLYDENDTTAVSLETSSTWLHYPLVASSSLLVAYLAFLIVKWSYSRSALVQGWIRRLTGKPLEEKMLLHTLPYYLAISRSSCEVNWLLFPLPQHLVFRYMF